MNFAPPPHLTHPVSRSRLPADTRRMAPSKLLFALLLTAVTSVACWDDGASDPAAPSSTPQTIAQSGDAAQDLARSEGTTRWDAPWWDMSDEELQENVAEADGRVLIGFKESDAETGIDRGRSLVRSETIEDALAMLQSRSAENLRLMPTIPVVAASISPSDVPYLRAHPLVEYVEPSLPVYSLQSQDTTWAVHSIQAPPAWDSTTGAAMVVAVVDTGIEGSHSDLNPASLHSCMQSSGTDTYGHGTEVAGMIAAQASPSGIIGAAHGVTLRGVKVTNIDTIASGMIACGISRADSLGADIINMSFGSDGGTTIAIADAVSSAYNRGALLVAAGGNEDDAVVTTPARLSDVIAVIGVSSTNTLYPGTPSGPQVELVAPGFQDTIRTTCLGDIQCFAPKAPPSDPPCLEPGDPGYDPEEPCHELGVGGDVVASSYAAAFVSAAAALVWSHNPGWTNEQVRNRLRATATDLGSTGRDDDFGYGLVQALDALEVTLPAAPEVSLEGPDEMQETATCTWDADVTGGMSPFTYTWYVHSYSVVGSGPSYTGDVPGGTTGGSFNLKVVVEDHLQRTDEMEIVVDVDQGAPVCLI